MDSKSYQGGSDPVTNPKPWASRIFHAFTVPAYLALLVLALVSLGSFAAKHNEIRTESEFALNPSRKGYCILFGTFDGLELVLNKSHVCGFMIWGEGVVAVIALALGLLAVLKAITGKKVISLLALGELIAIVIGTLLGLTISIILLVGFNQTCSAYSNNFPDYLSCSQYYIPTKDFAGQIKFYDAIKLSQVTAWIGTGVMFFLGLVYIGILVLYCIRASNRKTTEIFQPSEPPLLSSPDYDETPN